MIHSPEQRQKCIDLVRPHIEEIRKFESSWDNITLSRIIKNINKEVAFAYWDIITTNREILNTL